MKGALLTLLIVCSGQARAETLRPFNPDRPDKTDSPFTVPKDHTQVELDFATYTRDTADGVRTETLNVSPINIRAAVSDTTEVQLIFGSYIREVRDDPSAGIHSRSDGIGDLTLRVKHNLWGNDGGKTALGIIPFVTLPTSTTATGNRLVEGGVALPFSVELDEHADLGVMSEVDLVAGDTQRYAAAFKNSASASFDLTEKLGLYTELYTEKRIEEGADWIVTGDTGLTYKIGDAAEIDGGVNIGLSDAADDVNLFAGLSFRF